MVIRNAKNALNAGLVSNANLNVSLLKKTSLVVDSIALDKNSLDRLECRQPSRFPDFVEMVYHRAIEVP
jgi:hypothetical protein